MFGIEEQRKPELPAPPTAPERAEREDGALDIPVERLIERCVALYLRLLRP